MERQLLICFILIIVSPVVDKTYPIYQQVFFGPLNCIVKAYGNYDMNSLDVSNDNEIVNAQTAINNMINYYHKSNFQRGPTYFLQYYKDSSLNAVVYILFQKKNYSSTTKYYYLRALNKNSTGYYMGVESCPSCRAGRQMPLMKYSNVTLQNSALVTSLIDLAKGINSNYTNSNIVQIKYWQFPLGNLYIVKLLNSNSTNTLIAIVNTTNSSLVNIGYTYFPIYHGNVYVDQLLVNHYMQWSLKYLISSVNLSQIIFFQYYIDQLQKNYILFMLNVNKNGTKNYTRYFGALMPYYTSTNNVSLFDTFNYTTISQNEYFTSSYFHNNHNLDSYDERMGTNTTDPTEYKYLLQWTAYILQGNMDWVDKFNQILDLIYIDLPNNLRLFRVLASYKFPNVRTMYIWFSHNKTSNQRNMPFYVTKQVLSNYSFNAISDWKDRVAKQVQYQFEYLLLTNEFSLEYFHQNSFYQAQYCSFENNRYEIFLNYRYYTLDSGVVRRHKVSRFVFLRDSLTNKILFLGNYSASLLVPNVPPTTNQCIKIKGTKILPSDFQSNFSSIGPIVNSNNQQFLLSEITNIVKLNTEIVGAKTIYSIDFLKNNTSSSIIIGFNATSSLYTIIDYVESFENTESGNSSTSFPLIGAKPMLMGGNGSILQQRVTNTTTSTFNSNTNSTTNANTSTNINNNLPNQNNSAKPNLTINNPNSNNNTPNLITTNPNTNANPQNQNIPASLNTSNSPNTNSGTSNKTLNQNITFTSMSSADIRNETVLYSIYQQIVNSFSTIISTQSLTKVQKGVFPNKTNCYQFYYAMPNNLNNPNYIAKVYYDTVVSRIILIVMKSFSKAIASTTTQNAINQHTAILKALQDRIVQLSIRSHPEVKNYLSLHVKITENPSNWQYGLNYRLANGRTYSQIIEVSHSASTFKEISFERSL